MKLRNKRTGEIKPAEAREDGIYLYDEITEQWYKYELDLLAKWWEYYEEPKEYWIIDTILHEIRSLPYKNNEEDKRYEQWLEELGLKFETKEEAEKAEERLHAWKRLKDKGFRFCGGDDACISYEADIENWSMQDLQDFDLLFGGKE